MKTISTVFLLFFLTFSLPLSAQFNILKDKLKDKIEKSNKKDKKKSDAEEGDVEEDAEAPAFDMSQFFGSGDVELEDSYDYQFKIDWKITANDDDEPSEMSQFFSREETSMGMEYQTTGKDAQEGAMIIDFDKNYMILISKEEQQAVVTSFDNVEAQVEEEDISDTPFSITKTGETKSILGYKCEKYKFVSEDAKGEMWVTKGLNYANYNIFNYLKRAAKRSKTYSSSDWSQLDDGFALEIYSESEDGEINHMIATAIDENANISYKMDDYQIMDLTKLPKGLGN